MITHRSTKFQYTDSADLNLFVNNKTKSILAELALNQKPKVRIDKEPVFNYFELEENRKRGLKPVFQRYEGSDVKKPKLYL